MAGHFPVVLDACVLVPYALRDTLLRLAEKGLYLPRWSGEIIQEMSRTLGDKLQLQPEKIAYLVGELQKHFEDAWVEGYEFLISSMSNHEGDRHVLAAAVRCSAEVIVTRNLKHFPEDALRPWNIELRSPDDFLIDLFYLNPLLVALALQEQAAEQGWGIRTLLEESLIRPAPKFVRLVTANIWPQGPPTVVA
jgi:predicted nucleic acid-binding protein